MRRLFIAIFSLLAFSIHPLQAAETRGLTVIAKDPATNQSSEVKLYNKSYAVIIGIDRYQNLTDRQLAYAVKDAEGVLATLKRHYRFDRIATLYNEEATKERIMKLLTSELPRDMGPDDAVFIFWAGHGNQESSADGEIGYLIPFDGSTEEIYKNITMTEIRDTVSKKLPAKHVFYAFDACYSGLLTTRSVDAKSRRDLTYLKEITKERVRQVLTAGSKGQEVLDGGRNGHSVFTGRLIEILEEKGDYITANEIQAIIKEKVYGDAIGRGLNQKPDFGRLSGSGDFVFIPNLAQKVQDNKAEVARIEAELKRLEDAEAEAKLHQTKQQQREAEQKRKAAEAKLKAEQLRQQQLAEETNRQQEMAAERARFEEEQKVREQELASANSAEAKRIATLKTELALKKQAAPTTASGSFEAAIAGIRRLNAEIESIEAAFNNELITGKSRINSRYSTEIAAVRQSSKKKQKPLVKDEFDTEAEYQQKVAKQKSSFSDRIKELEQKQQSEIAALEQRIAHEQQNQTADLRQSLKQLADKEFTVGEENLVLELGQYNPDKQNFPVNIHNRTQNVKVAMNGVITLPRDAAKKFKQEYASGLVRPQGTVKAGSGEVITIVLANDADNSIYEHVGDEFITVAERKRRAEERERERERQTTGEMVKVPGGCFLMGGKREPVGNVLTVIKNSKPVHEVCLSAFLIGKYEVTQGQWRRIMGSNPSRFSNCGDDCPVEQVSWNIIQEFLQKLNSQTGKSYRLPTEAEWEYACRSGGKDEIYCGGNNENAVAWHNYISGNMTHAVGQRQPNGLGIYDMSGNVWEWVSDCYDYNESIFGDTNYYSVSPRNNPQGPSCSDRRVLRGGSWYNAWDARAVSRSGSNPDDKFDYYGFRLAISEE